MTVGQRIRALRRERGFTQKELGEMVGTDASNIGKHELDKQMPRITMLEKIASALDVPLTALVDDEEKEIDLSTVSTEDLLKEIHKRII
jgi:transcriptional regulator with XRE-family HTH domain